VGAQKAEVAALCDAVEDQLVGVTWTINGTERTKFRVAIRPGTGISGRRWWWNSEEEGMLKATLIAGGLLIATTALAQQNPQQQPQTPGSPTPQTQGETPLNAKPTQERNTGLPSDPSTTGSQSGESRSTGDRAPAK